MRTILIGNITKEFKTLEIEKAYTKNGFSGEKVDCDLRYLGPVDHGLSGERGFGEYGMKGE